MVTTAAASAAPLPVPTLPGVNGADHASSSSPAPTTAKNGKKAAPARRRRKKKGKSTTTESAHDDHDRDATPDPPTTPLAEPLLSVNIEYVPETVDAGDMAEYFGSVFAKFTPAEPEAADEDAADHAGADQDDAAKDQGSDMDEDNDEDMNGEQQEMSNRKMRKLNRLSVAELKQLVDKPEVVEWVDVTAADPKLLVDLKSTRNTVPVPIHWSQKRKYLQNKRGLEKAPFELPDFIKATGIQEMREAVGAKDENATLKAKTRERVAPKMGKLVIDYAKLHDAFFKWQTKPDMTAFGEMYYEGREFETKLKNVRPGAPLSEGLRRALNMPPMAPPPWLLSMQRYGPPPSYPGLKIPGLNAPIPLGAQWGFHPGGWGKPPVDEYGRPLYGDVFGTMYDAAQYDVYLPPGAKELWGEIPPQADEEEEEEDDDEIASEGEDMDLGQDETVDRVEAITTLGGDNADDDARPTVVDHVPRMGDDDAELDEYMAALNAPEDLDLRKSTAVVETDDTLAPRRELYTVLEERKVNVGKGLMGTDRVYDIRKRPADEMAETPMSMSASIIPTAPSTLGRAATSDSVADAAKKKRKIEDKKRKDFKF
ncbi:hypothetical protein AMAG_13974 [Allomyces macrogynus ATCC 38327]|uniref:PSP proline-rich domain-containing protein n=1 Tax=Allomyces macrogynus (strain ATCC 38327) TaxID=578462 RepID=A0A0L0T305_ALLM3|nr:hypothetical protein AMAG_13974 [Allomyces macrogynus ATCC 38327]|eukprot:KNE69116.1 hypothetical protein AMAG_13974 [Allomyces macrogynus ATCC 38327]